jgi:hypothetical protein
MKNLNSFPQNNYKNRIKSEILILEKSKKQNRLLAIGFFMLLFILPFVFYSPFVLIPMVFSFAGGMAFLTEIIEDQKEINLFRKNF